MSEAKGRRLSYGQRIAAFAAVAVLGVGLLIFGGYIGKQGGASSEQVGTNPSPEEYAASVEARVASICKEATGYDAKVVVSLAGGYRAVYAEDSQTVSGGYKSSMVLVGSGKEESAVLVCYENPEISGIGVVLSCGEDALTESRVISLISAAFSLKTNKIYVVFSG